MLDLISFVHSPEFLRTTSALDCVLKQSRVVIGGIGKRSSSYVADLFRELYCRVSYELSIYVASLKEAESMKCASSWS